jgi:hypothetical protein
MNTDAVAVRMRWTSTRLDAQGGTRLDIRAYALYRRGAPLSWVEDSLYQSATTRRVVVEPSFVIVAVRPMPAM